MALPPTRRGRDYFLTAPKFLILSPPKHGKTLLCATYSKFFEGWNRPDGARFIELNDLLWVAFDPNAIVGLVEQGYDVPIIDLSDKVGTALLPALDDFDKEIVKRLEGHEKEHGAKLRALVVDTASFLDKNLNEWFGRLYSDPRDKFSSIGERHTRIANRLKSLSPDVALFVLCHAKSDQPLKSDDVAGRAKERASGLPGSGGVSSALTGQTKGTYEALVDGILPLCALEEQTIGPDKKPLNVLRRVLYPRGGNGFEGATRYMRFLDKEEPADLGKMLAKIRSCWEKSLAQAPTPAIPAAAV